MTERLYKPANSMEGGQFMAAWCSHCAKMRKGCQIFGAAGYHEIDEPGFPREWRYEGEKPTCSAYVYSTEKGYTI